MPSSLFRSSASITKMLTSSSTPASTLNMPSDVNSCEKLLPLSSASRSRSCLRAVISAPLTPARRRRSSSTTGADRLAPSNTPPSFDISTMPLGGVAAGLVLAAAIASMVPGAIQTASEPVPLPV